MPSKLLQISLDLSQRGLNLLRKVLQLTAVQDREG